MTLRTASIALALLATAPLARPHLQSGRDRPANPLSPGYLQSGREAGTSVATAV